MPTQITQTTGVVTASPPATKRKKAPKYDVYRLVTESSEGAYPTALIPVATDVAAGSRKEAIAKQDDPWGTFAVCRAGELVVLTRNKKVVEQDDWS